MAVQSLDLLPLEAAPPPGMNFVPGGTFRMDEFPHQNAAVDGYERTSR